MGILPPGIERQQAAQGIDAGGVLAALGVADGQGVTYLAV
jgi:hypothetical protein